MILDPKMDLDEIKNALKIDTDDDDVDEEPIILTEEESGALLSGRILVTDDATGQALICLTAAALTGGGLS